MAKRGRIVYPANETPIQAFLSKSPMSKPHAGLGM